MESPTEYQWKVFSKLFREYHSNQFDCCVCFTCGKVAHWKKMDTGHFIDRRFAATKFNPLNLEVQCVHCNRHLDGNIEVYKKQLMIKYGGWDVVSHLNHASLNGKLPSKSDVQGLITIYRKMVDLKNNH
jgi:hypothetical protein